MAGVCNTCKYFRGNVHTAKEKPHHCDFQNVVLSESQSRENCEECIPKSKGCCH